MNKEFIEREINRRKQQYYNGGYFFLVMGVLSLIITIFNDINFLLGFIVFIILAIISFLYPKFMDEQRIRDYLIRNEELRDAQLNVLKKGHKGVHMIGKMRKLR